MHCLLCSIFYYSGYSPCETFILIQLYKVIPTYILRPRKLGDWRFTIYNRWCLTKSERLWAFKVTRAKKIRHQRHNKYMTTVILSLQHFLAITRNQIFFTPAIPLKTTLTSCFTGILPGYYRVCANKHHISLRKTVPSDLHHKNTVPIINLD